MKMLTVNRYQQLVDEWIQSVGNEPYNFNQAKHTAKLLITHGSARFIKGDHNYNTMELLDHYYCTSGIS